MDFHGVWDDQTGLSPRLLRPPVEGVDGGVRVCVPFPKAVVWHSYGILLNASTKHFFLENVVNEIGVCRISRHAVI